MILNTAGNLLAGLKLATLFPSTRLDDFQRSLSSLFLLVTIGTIALAVFGYTEQEGEIYFNDFGAACLGATLLVATVVALIISRIQGSLDRLPDLLALVAAAFPWVVVALSGLSLLLEPTSSNNLYWLLALAWCIAIVIRAIHLTFPEASGSLYLGTAVLIAGLAFGAAYRGYSPALFFSYDSSDYEQYASLDAEEIFLSQSRLLSAELEKLAPGRPDETEFYFLGFAGNGDEAVFSSEAHFAQEQVADQFLTQDRSIVLASDFDNVDSRPLANTHNLFEAISHMGSRMDVDDDVLFLFLTSHGSKDASIQVSLFPLQLKQLAAEDLRAALDAAGIEWRIIVVSACYSGSFIEPLKNDRTMVMTASAAETTSFGCSNDRDLTYFGEAFFRDSFGDAGSLIEKFDQAKTSIGEREAQEGRTSSNPQIFVGAEIKEKLAEIANSRRSIDH